jgi:phosphoglycerol transferase MdoB-like AlkP superfamily enzyme
MIRRMKNKYFALALGFLLAAGISSACRARTAPRNFILMTLDTLRADHVGVITPGGAATPNLDALAGRGILFKNCYSLIPITLPSHASIFYSQPPHLLKNYNNAQSLDLKKDLPSLAPLFEGRGFATAAFVSLGVVRASFGLNKGFMTYVDDFPADRWYLRAGEVNGRVFPWLESHKDKPFFLWVHYSDPHEPYTPPGAPADLDIFVNGRRIGSYCLSNYTINTAELPLKTGDNEIRLEVKNDSDEFPYHARFDLYKLESPDESGLKIDRYRDFFFWKEDQTYFFKRTAAILVSNAGKPRSVTMTFRGKLILPMKTMRENYRREVEYMDSEIGRFWAKLKDLGLDENTAIVAVGDHGEGLGEYLTEDGIRYYGHIHFLQDAFLKVPLIIYDPAAPNRPAVREEFVTLLDIAPSVMDIMGLKSPSRFLGRDLLKLENGALMEVFEETYKPEAWRDKFGLLAFPWHLIFTPEKQQIEVYDLTKGPDEHDDLFVKGNLPDAVISLRRKLEARAREVVKTKEAVRVDKKDEDMLRSLGYIK